LKTLTRCLCLSLIIVAGVWSEAAERRVPTYVTITQLPPFPTLPSGTITEEERHQLIWDLIDHKLSTYPLVPYTSSRIPKFAGTGLFSDFALKDSQLKKMAETYSHNILAPSQAAAVQKLKSYNPAMKLFMYIDSGIHPDKELPDMGYDIGNIDDQNIDWILTNHPDWLLRDAAGNPIRSGAGTLSFPGEYWPDPGNTGFQDFFAAKIVKAMTATGVSWAGLHVDQFFGSIDNYTGYAGANQQTKYKTDTEFQAAQLALVKRVAEVIKLPVLVNLDGMAAQVYPHFFIQIAETGGGVESEIFPFENSVVSDQTYLPEETLKELLDCIRAISPSKYVRLNSKPGGMEGDIDRTLYAYFNYLLVASPGREVNWTFKEGDSGIPHYWFKEFDLDIGLPQTEMQVIGTFTKDNMGRSVLIGDLWKREFANVTVLVNPRGDHDAQYTISGSCYNVLGTPLSGTITVKARTAMLVIKNLSILASVDDADGDGLLDSWEVANFGSIDDPRAKLNLDPDGDGFTNLSELQAGTSPLSSSSRFAITDEAFPSSTSFRIQWQSVLGKNYEVQTSADLVNWTTVTTLIATATSTTWTHSGLSGIAKKFYRVRSL
jgi:hypothetical protein